MKTLNRMVALLLMGATLASAQTTYPLVLTPATQVGPTTPRKAGINLASQAFYDSGQIRKNLVSEDNPGFEAVKSKPYWVLYVAGTRTTFSLSGTDNYASFPANFYVGATVTVVESAGAELGCVGTVSANAAGTPATFTLSGTTNQGSSGCAAALSIGDQIIIQNNRFPTPEADWEAGLNSVWANISNGGKLLSDTTTNYSADGGLQSLVLDVTAGSTATSGVTEYFDTDSQNNFVLLNGTYSVSGNARILSGSNNKVHVCAGRTSPSCSTVTATSSWAPFSYSATFSETHANTSPGNNAFLSVQALGSDGIGQVEVDNLSFQKTSGQDSTNTTVFRDEVVTALRQYCATSNTGARCMLRDWVNQNGKDMAGWTASYSGAPQAASGGGAATSGQSTPQLQEFFQLCALVGADPYLEFPVSASTADAQAFVDFVGSTNTASGYGAIRAAQGQTAPWTTVFPAIYTTFVNETWNGSSFAGQAMYYRGSASSFYYDYANRAKDIYAAMRADSNFSSVLHLGFSMQEGVNYASPGLPEALTLMKAVGGSPDYIEQADYLPSTVSNWQTTAALWDSDLEQPYEDATNASSLDQFYQAVKAIQALNLCGASGTSACEATQYEFGDGPLQTCGTGDQPSCTGAANSQAVNQASLDRLSAGGGGGIVYALSYLLNMRNLGMNAQNIFGLTEYTNSTLNSSTLKAWGLVVDMGGDTSSIDGASVRWRPNGLGMILANNAILGIEFDCHFTSPPTYNWAGDAWNGPTTSLSNVPYIDSFCFKNGSTISIDIINSSLTNSYNASFSGSSTPTGTCAIQQLNPSSPNAMNEAMTPNATNATAATVAIVTSSTACPTTLAVPALSQTVLTYSTAGGSGGGGTVTPAFHEQIGPGVTLGPGTKAS